MSAWIITGSSRGLGLEFARQLSRDKSNTVIATCRNPATASDLKDLLKDASGNLHIVQLDQTDQKSITASVQEVEAILGAGKGLDYILNNAAINTGNDSALDLDEDGFIETMKANVIGPARVAKAYIPLLEKGERKVLMNMSSGLGSIGRDLGPKAASYSISKTALNMLTYKIQKDKPELIAFIMDPGWNKTDMGGEGAVLDPADSVASMIGVLKGLKKEDAGSYLTYQGEPIPW